ncbi:MAG: phosphate acyltransferase PlsX [Acidimicrobiia bacterium]
MSESRITVAVDAMGGDRAPAEIVAGALQAVAELPVDILLVGREEAVREVLPGGEPPEHVTLVAASEVIDMHDDPAASVRTRKDASMVRCAEAVRDGRAQAMVGAGNTGATMASALLRMGRIKGVARPAIAVPVPVPGSHGQLLVDGGATVDCRPEWLVQFARMGREYARVRLGVEEPTVGLLSVGEEPGKGDALRKEVHPMLAEVKGFVGNVEGREFMTGHPDVILSDGFTGNVALKTMEGVAKAVSNLVFGVLVSTPEAKEAAKVLAPLLLEAAAPLDPDNTGGAVLLGIDGVCVISHGSSSARAIVNACQVAADAVAADVVTRLKEAIADAG